MTNDKFDDILTDITRKNKQEKAKKEALRQVNYERYYNDYHNMVMREKRHLQNKNKIRFFRLFCIALVLSCVIVYCYFYFFQNVNLFDLFISIVNGF